MMTFKVDHVGHAWKTLVENVIMCGEYTSPRGLSSKEIEDVILEYPYVKGFTFINAKRKINPVFHLVELFYFLNGRTDYLLTEYVHGMKEFENNVHRFDGSYGPSIYESLPFAIRSLEDDRDSRRAVVPIIRSHHLNHDSRDIPCNVFLSFRIRKNHLNMDVFTRSQDLYRGFLYDTLEFQLLQRMIASIIDTDPGSYIHHILSLHLYEKDVGQAIESLTEEFNGSLAPILPDFQNQDDMWRYARKVNSIMEFLVSPGEEFDDIQNAIVSWRLRKSIFKSGLYSDWVNWWLGNRS